LPCLGPVTAGGCGALCPTAGAACYGCWGPCESPQMDAMALILSEKGFKLNEVITRLQTFGAPAELFTRLEKMA
jgi:sulfhydrogenase subunit delta